MSEIILMNQTDGNKTQNYPFNNNIIYYGFVKLT